MHNSDKYVSRIEAVTQSSTYNYLTVMKNKHVKMIQHSHARIELNS